MTDSDELVGRFSSVSLLPQYLCFTGQKLAGLGDLYWNRGSYLMTAIFTGAVVLARYILFSAMLLYVMHNYEAVQSAAPLKLNFTRDMLFTCAEPNVPDSWNSKRCHQSLGFHSTQVHVINDSLTVLQTCNRYGQFDKAMVTPGSV